MRPSSSVSTPKAAREIWRALTPEPALLAEYRELTETVVRMELIGLVVDPAELDRAEQAFAEIEAELTTQIETLAGHPFNINSGKQLGTVLFEELALPIVSHTKTGWSTAIEALERIEHAHPIVPLVLRWRLLRRLRDSWVIALRRCIDTDGRVHSRSHPARSFSGHLVNTNPDLSRVPGRTPEMQMIRRAFVAAPGRLLMSVDFESQLGLHVLAHLTKDPALVEPLRRRDGMHALTASAVLEKPLRREHARRAPARQGRQLRDVCRARRERARPATRRAGAGRPRADRALRSPLCRGAPRSRTSRSGSARERGYIVTIAGRRWPIGGLESRDSHDRSYAERLARRATHEGSVSDVSRRALLDADRALRAAGLATVPVLQILDEVLFDVAEAEVSEAARVASSAMQHAFELEVPLVVGIEVGRTWSRSRSRSPRTGRFDPGRQRVRGDIHHLMKTTLALVLTLRPPAHSPQWSRARRTSPPPSPRI